jgi:VanZ family protein
VSGRAARGEGVRQEPIHPRVRRVAAAADPALVWLAGWTLCVVIATLYPFDFGPAEKEARYTIRGDTLRLSDAVDIGLNVLLFVPVGALLSHIGQRRMRTWLPIAALAGIGALLMSGVVESLQAYLPFRDSSLIDLLSNAAGGVVGAAAHQRWRSQAARLRDTISPAVLTVATLALTIAALALSALLQRQTRLSDWSPDYPLLIGNEDTGDRPWRGRVFSFEVTDGATPRTSLRQFADGGGVALGGTRVAAVDLSGAGPYRDETGRLPVLEWTTFRRNGRAIQPHGPPWLRTRGPASDLARRIRETNTFTLYVRCATHDPHQSGPARILSNSASRSHRNFTLGQEGRNLVIRVRTPLTGQNGATPEAVVGDVFTDSQPRELLVTYDGATLMAAVAGAAKVYSMELGPRLDVWERHNRTRVGELQAQRLAYLAGLCVMPGALFGLARTTARRVVFGAAWIVAFATLLETTLVVTSGREFQWSNVGVNAVVGAAVLTLAAGTVATILSGPKERKIYRESLPGVRQVSRDAILRPNRRRE